MAITSITPSGTIENSVTVMLSGKELVVQQMNLAAQNLSNSDTVGFKGLVQTGIESVYTNPAKHSNFPTISYVQPGMLLRDLAQGTIKETQNPLNMALIGQGYFAVQVGDQKLYTRDGRFRLDATGTLVTADGYPVLSQGGLINLSTYTKYVVENNGTIIGVDVNDVPTEVGQLIIVNFADQQLGLQNVGNGRFATNQEELSVPDTLVHQGALELSNVNSMTESVNLMRMMQMYEESQRITEMDDEIKRKVINLRIN